jgi:hypothetical protein
MHTNQNLKFNIENNTKKLSSSENFHLIIPPAIYHHFHVPGGYVLNKLLSIITYEYGDAGNSFHIAVDRWCIKNKTYIVGYIKF